MRETEPLSSPIFLALRIPIRGYEKQVGTYTYTTMEVTNPYKGL